MITGNQSRPAVLSLLGACVLVCASARAMDAQDNAGDLVGTWQVSVTLHNCQTKAPIGAPFDSLLTFAEGGTLTESTANAMFFPAIRGPGQGVWSRSRHRGQYTAASIAFITMNGMLVKSQKITQSIEMGPGSDVFLTPQAAIEFFDPAGNVIATGCASAVGRRFEA